MGMSTGGGGGGGRAPLSEINVTPLVDVMLVLLIIFMVSAPLMTSGVEVDLPKAEAPTMEIDEDLPLIVVRPVTDAGGEMRTEIYYFDELVSPAALLEKLKTDPRLKDPKSEGRRVFIQADTAVPYGEVVKVLAQVQSAGIEQMGLVTDPISKK